MSEILDSIGAVLQSASVGTLGTTIFLSRFPSTPDACVTVYETGAGYPLYTQGSSGAARLSITNVQVVARSTREDYEAARTKITAVIAALEAINETTAASIRLLRAERVGSVVPLGFDDNDRPRVAVTFMVTHE